MKWPKVLPPLTEEQRRINDDFMKHWHEVFPKRYGFADRFNHEYVAKRATPGFLRTLEVGAGLGEHCAYESLTPEQEENYTAIDIRPAMVEAMKVAYPRFNVLVADCQERLDFADDHFDRIIAIHVLEHLPNLPAAARELHRVCNKQRGSFQVVIPCEGSLATTVARRISAQRIYERRYKTSYSNFIGREHINLPWEILAELERFFTIRHRSFYPIPLPMLFCNLFMGLTLTPKPAGETHGSANAA